MEGWAEFLPLRAFLGYFCKISTPVFSLLLTPDSYPLEYLQCLAKKLVFCLFMKQSKGCLRGHKLSLKCCYDHNLLNPSKRIVGLSKEVVYDLIDQRATKLQSLKVCSVWDSNLGRSESTDSLCKLAKT